MNYFVCHECLRRKEYNYEVTSHLVEDMAHLHIATPSGAGAQPYSYYVRLMRVQTEKEAREFYGLKGEKE